MHDSRTLWLLPSMLLILAACQDPSIHDVGPPYDPASWDIVPLPSKLEVRPGRPFYFGKGTPVVGLPDAEGAAEKEAQRLREYIEAGTHWTVPSSSDTGTGQLLSLALDPSLEASFGSEGYRLEIGEHRIELRARTADGLFYGGQTLRQMLSPSLASAKPRPHFKGNAFAQGLIEDAPRFGWRGMHLDVGRYFFAVEDIKSFLDCLAFYKFNVFHWHLTEDQGWRIEILKYPRLTEVGAFRKSSPLIGDRQRPDGKPYGGFYTQDEIREVVAYAAELKIDVMPEIELPGHSLAAIAAYPELGNPEFSQGLEVGTRWGVHPNILNPSEATLGFYEDVFEEVLGLFPFEFVHIGGDEAPKTQWEQSPTAQARMQELGIEDEHGLQAWFVAHFERYLSERGRRLVGWDEIQEGGLPQGATMMVWRGWHYGVEAARKGHDVIMAPTSHTYFDYYQGDPAHEPEAIGGLLTLEHVYSFEPIPEELSEEEARHVLGAQAQLWSEYLPSWEQVEYMASPRMQALSEVLWSPKEARDWTGFQSRLTRQLAHLDARGVNYRIPVPVPALDAIFFRDSIEVSPGQLFESNGSPLGSWMVHTRDGSQPTLQSERLGKTFELSESSTLQVARMQRRERLSRPASIRFVKLSKELPIPGSMDLVPGLWRQVFSGVQAKAIPDFAELLGAGEPAGKGGWRVQAPTAVSAVALDGLEGQDRFAVRFSGWIQVSQEGVYRFRIGSDDGSRITIAGIPVVDLDGPHGHLTKTGRVQLPAGLWPFEVGYFDAGGAESLELEIEGPGGWSFLRKP